MARDAMPGRVGHALWSLLLIAVAAISSLAFACVTPFAAFAVAAAYVLPARAALLAVAGVWLANQAVGFGALGYPWTGDTVLWGSAIGASALIGTSSVSLVLRSAPQRRFVIALAIALPIAFVAYEAGLLMVTFGLGGQEAFTPTIIGKFALLNLAWAVALVGPYEALRYMVGGLRPWHLGSATG
jgi:hypothetical protein